MIHSFLRIIDTPILSQENIDEYVKFIDSVVKAFTHSPFENPELFQLPEDLPEDMRNGFLNKLEYNLSIVRQYTDRNLDHGKKYSQFW